ncbi:DUF2235 domain-containing protein [Rubrivivax sp. RP6-9]|uniref:DUF2235 domain-containing protein n=1 Tax=Rubrivivax sp. RP6-9 TaxID=3415750 RepID=UPI003CC562D0
MATKNIVLCIDGTWNAPMPLEDTNVLKLYEWSLVPNDGAGPQQVCCYLPGVGEDMRHVKATVNSRVVHRQTSAGRVADWFRQKANALTGGVSGRGTAERIKVAYQFLCENYVRGDRIYIFGFSRGAFAARSLAGFVALVGVLLANRLDDLPEAYRLYELARDEHQSWLKAHMQRLDMRTIESQEEDSALPIHFLGVWDTVGALGLPRRLGKFTAKYTEYHQVDVPPNVFIARHAMALHELRPDFDLMLWSDLARHPNLRQVWFPGDHADIGGGHWANESGYADEALHWMAGEAAGNGLRLNDKVPPRNSKELHQQWLWFILTNPTIRPEIRELPQVPGNAWHHATYCHPSLLWHLHHYGKSGYRFLNAGLNLKLKTVDGLATQLLVRAKLHNLHP